eukprot:scaffold11988_cov18-Tisochrysis_lutea.AAC.3
MTVQRNLRVLKEDCENILARWIVSAASRGKVSRPPVSPYHRGWLAGPPVVFKANSPLRRVLADDKQKKAENLSRRMYGILYYLLASMSTCLLVSLV